MSFVYDALEKAEREGKLDSTWIPHVEEKPGFSPPAIELPLEVIDNFTMLKQNVQLAHAEKGVQVIAITSAIPGEGCSTITYYLSLLLAQSSHGTQHVKPEIDEVYSRDNGHRPRRRSGILVIDGNLKNPGLHSLFNIDPKHGVNEFVVANNAKKTVISPNHFDFVTSGKINGNWHDIWASERTKTLMEQLRNQFEYILIDAPPVIGHPDTLALSKLADGVLFVIKANQTRLEVIEDARAKLKEAEVKLLGVVLNERRFFIPGGIYRRI